MIQRLRKIFEIYSVRRNWRRKLVSAKKPRKRLVKKKRLIRNDYVIGKCASDGKLRNMKGYVIYRFYLFSSFGLSKSLIRKSLQAAIPIIKECFLLCFIRKKKKNFAEKKKGKRKPSD